MLQSEVAIDRVDGSVVVQANAGRKLARVRIWDLPVRVFHWSLVAAVCVAVVTGELGGSLMAVHAKAGYTIVWLLSFRLVWGVVGSTHARFLSFFPSPKKIRSYLQGRWHGAGHNPLGALSVLGLLGLLALQAGTGLFANDDIDFNGPLSGFIDKGLSNRLTGLHHQLATVLLILMAAHMIAIVFYVLVKKDNLIKPMVTGWKEVPAQHASVKENLLALALALSIATVVALEVSYASKAQTSSVKPVPQTQSQSW